MPTLAAIEQEVARRVGPYKILTADATTPTISTTTFGVMPYMQSSLALDEFSGLYALRRGVHADGSAVATLNPLDRTRRVLSVDSSKGVFEVDRPWQNPLDPVEVVEFHHLDPEQELRPAVLAGLRRCTAEDRFLLGPGFVYEADLTAAVPWLTTPNQVRLCQAGPNPGGWPGVWGGMIDLPFETFMECGHVWLRIANGDMSPYYGGLYITALHSFVDLAGGCPGGAIEDAANFSCDLDWAAAMGHIEAWHLGPARLQAAAGVGWQSTQQMAANEASRQAWLHRPPSRDKYAFDRVEMWGFGQGRNDGSTRPTVVNS
jgi:hypothetical protein